MAGSFYIIFSGNHVELRVQAEKNLMVEQASLVSLQVSIDIVEFRQWERVCQYMELNTLLGEHNLLSLDR